VTVVELNSLDRPAFVEAIGWVFEDSPWVAERAWIDRRFPDLHALHAAMVEQVERATDAERLALLRAHPDLGARARMSDASTGEQARAGLDGLADDEHERLRALTAAYRERFGFPFLLAVKGKSKGEIFRALQARMESLPEEEYREALQQVYRIARFRLEAALTDD
jgi:OHCU decarboxylase